MSACRFCTDDAGQLTWCSPECIALDCDQHVTVMEIQGERAKLVRRLMSKSHWAIAEEQALLAQVRILDELLRARGSRPDPRATPPGPWRYDCEGNAEMVDGSDAAPLELEFAEEE